MPDSQPSSIYQVDLEPVGRRIDIPAGMTISQAAQAAGIEVVSICGGLGSCGTCRVRLISGSLSKLTPAEMVAMSPEEIQDGFRLACQARPLSDVCIHIPPESLTTPQRLQIEGQGIVISPDPPVTSINISVPT